MCCEPALAEHMPFPPSEHAQVRHLNLDPVPSSVSLARSFVRESVAGLGDDDVEDVATLLTSELVTNAILHARTPVHLGVTVDDDRTCVSVGDSRSDRSNLQPLPPSQDRPGGRGLAMVNDLAQAWGTATYAGGKTVWFVLATARRSLRTG